MAVFKFEVLKLLKSTSLWMLLLIFFIFNLFLIGSTRWDSYPDFVGEVAKITGTKLDDSFSERIETVSVASQDREMFEQFKEDTSDPINHFDDYHITEVGDLYVNYLNSLYENDTENYFTQQIREKYVDMQMIVDEKARKDEALSLSHASSTTIMHQNLFDTILGWLLIEGVILSVLISLQSIGYEKGNETETIVYTTNTGRNIVIKKLTASLLVGLGAYFLLIFSTLLVYLSLHDYSALWSSYVSNIFNYRNDMIAGYRPFVTWQSHTILTYLLSKIGVSLGLIICYILSAFIVELIIRNNYISFIVILILSAAFIVLPLMIPSHSLRSYIMLSPVWLWLKHPIWFTDGDVDIVWKNFEMLGTSISLLLLIMGTVIVFNRFKRRDLL